MIKFINFFIIQYLFFVYYANSKSTFQKIFVSSFEPINKLSITLTVIQLIDMCWLITVTINYKQIDGSQEIKT